MRSFPSILMGLLLVGLAWFAGDQVLPSAANRAFGGEVHTFELEAREGPVTLEAAFVDGREREKEDQEVTRSGFEPGARNLLTLHAEDAATSPALWQCRGSTLTLGVRIREGGGKVVVRRSGTEIVVVDSSRARADDIDGVRWLSVPELHPGLGWRIGWAVLLLLLLAWSRFWRGDDRSAARTLTLSVSITHLVCWLTQPVSLMHDSPYYFLDFWFYLRTSAPTYFPLGYGLFSSPALLCPETIRGLALTGMQAIVVVALTPTIFGWLRRSPAPAWLVMPAIWLALCGPISLLMTHGLYSEFPTVTGLLGACAFAHRSVQPDGKWLHAALAGFSAAMAGLARGLPLPIALVCFGVIFWPLIKPRRNLGRLMLAGAIAVTLFVAPLALIKLRQGMFALTMAGGEHLFNSVVQRRGYLPEEGPATEDFKRRIGDRLDRIWDTHHVDRRHWLEETGLTDRQAMNLQGEVAKEALREAPLEFVKLTLEQAWHQLPQHPDQPWRRATDMPVPQWNNAPLLEVTPEAIRWRAWWTAIERRIWPIVGWTSMALLVVGMALVRRRTVYALAACTFGMLIGTAAIELSYPRYTMTIMPLCWLALLLVPAWIAHKLRGETENEHGTQLET